jgi:hypothetical protein
MPAKPTKKPVARKQVPGVMFESDMVTKQNPPMALESGFRFHTAVILAMLPSVLMAHTGDHSEQTVSQGVVHMLLSWDHLLVCMLGGGLLGSSIGWSLGRIMAGSAITGLGLLGYQQWASGNTAWLMPALLLSILLHGTCAETGVHPTQRLRFGTSNDGPPACSCLHAAHLAITADPCRIPQRHWLLWTLARAS